MRGYLYCEKTNWWWNKDTQSVFSNESFKDYFYIFYKGRMTGVSYKGWIWYTHRKHSIDILETVFMIRHKQGNKAL